MKKMFSTHILGKILYSVGILIAVFCFIIFRWCIVPLVGWEFIVGRTNIFHDANHSKALGITNPIAIVLWWWWIVMVGYTLALIGKMMQVEDPLCATIG